MRLTAPAYSRRSGAAVFRFVSELAIAYRRSPVVVPGRPNLARAPCADRLPDAPLELNGRAVYLQEALAGTTFRILFGGASERWRALQATTFAITGVVLIAASARLNATRSVNMKLASARRARDPVRMLPTTSGTRYVPVRPTTA